ncbi:MAG TPA: flagellar basal body L-ring protein FlgH [Pirellulaceae bacterium]|nr:flagellar basal body L-ring protein FlgH [Pirellulaceae bacterium]HMO90910.1 flagellar basal body L-ring protein FlgH [Pirellulaceae bacterium]HMP68614.1 flagellar basal body L-ring protein FlgH [Pirellulaceae bacterium]
MFKSSIIGCFVMLCITVANSDAVAQNSIWMKRDANLTNPYADVKARRPGDLLIVQINERSDVQNRDQRLMQKQNSSSSDASITGRISGVIGNGNGGFGFDQESDANRQFNGNSQYRSERGFIDQFTVSIVDITPNGNMLVRGKRNVQLEGEQKTLVLTGIVRAADISPNNTISSSRIADLDIRYDSNFERGAEHRFINQGWLGKQMNKIWPY